MTAPALERLARADARAADAERAAIDAQQERSDAVRAAFDAGHKAPEISKILQVSPQRVYQIRDTRLGA